MDAYCVKCKTNREIQGERTVTMRNGRRAARGTCKTCGTGLNRILPGTVTARTRSRR